MTGPVPHNGYSQLAPVWLGDTATLLASATPFCCGAHVVPTPTAPEGGNFGQLATI